MLRWRRPRAACASRRKRRRSSGASARPGIIVLSATLRWMTGSSASYTVPMPPCPMTLWTWYLPMVSTGARRDSMPFWPGAGASPGGRGRRGIVRARARKPRRAALVVGLGIDLIELERVAAARARWGERFIRKLMDPPEAARLPSHEPEHSRALALAVAAKEAASKAIGTGWSRGVRWRDVEVVLGDAPRVVLHAAAVEWARRRGSAGETTTRLEIRGGLALGEVWLLS